MDNKISVIISVYNIEQYVEKCIQSVINQSFKDLEIIIVDDGSTDTSGQICDYYASKDCRIKVIHKLNGGLVSARKTGVKAATSEYITYVDGDDWIDSEVYYNMYSDMKKYDADIVIYEHFETVGDKNRQVHHNIPYGYHNKKSLIQNVYPNMIAGENFFEWRLFTSVCDKLFRRKILIGSQMEVDERLTIGEDVACVIPAMYEAESIYVSSKCFYHYRQTNASMVKTVFQIDEERERYNLLHNFVKEKLRYYGCSADINRQWIDFLLFIMVPRADHLYDGFDQFDYIFPFQNINKGMRIALYCAGTYGQRLYKYIQNSGVAEVVIWVDQNYEELRKMGLTVCHPSELEKCEYDAIIIATLFAESKKAIYEYVSSINNSIPIGIVDEKYIRTDEVLKGFRLI